MFSRHLCFVFTILIGYFVGTTINKLVLKACCNGDKNCREFDRPEAMFGSSCCGLNPLNDFEEICCDNVTRHKQQGAEFMNSCCGNQTISYAQTCCDGVIHNIPNGNCCGTQAYARNSYNILCCNGTLHTRVDPGATCCGNNPYDGGIKDTCCGGQVFLKDLFDGCCPVLNSKTPQYKQFNLKTHLCCDVPIERESNTKCCYLRNSNGTFTPKSYDYTSNCCAYPFQKITPKTGGTCIPNVSSGTETSTQQPGSQTTTDQSLGSQSTTIDQSLQTTTTSQISTTTDDDS